MRKKTAIAIIVILLIAIGLSYLYLDKIENALIPSKPALKVTISTGNSVTLGLQVTNMTFKQTTVPVFYRSVDSPVQFPDIDVEAKNDSIKNVPITYWASAERVKTNETYDFMLTFREPYVPTQGELLILSVRMNDFTGKLEYKTTAFYEWK